MQNIIQSFAKGMNTDTDLSGLGKGVYREARNLTFTSVDGGGIGALENVRGNALLATIGSPEEVIVGYVNIVEDTVFFTYNTVDLNSSIWLVESATNTVILKYTDDITVDGSKLNFSTAKKDRIVGVGRHENENVRKVYWTDGLNEVRYIHIERDYQSTIPGTYLSVDKFSMLPSVNLGKIDITEDSLIQGGNIEAGAVQYVYKLFNKYGAESNFSSATKLLFITELLPEGSKPFEGGDKDAIAHKSIKIDFVGIDNSFDYIRVYAIFYKSFFEAPLVNLVHEGELSKDTFSIIDTGDVLEELTLEEFNSIGGKLFTAEALASKHNHLFAANTKEKYFEAVDNTGEPLDCRSYRFRDNAGTMESVVRNEDFSESVIISPNGDWALYKDGVLDTDGSDWGIPLTFDCINWDNEIYNGPLLKNLSTLYQKDGLHIGGSGKIINYKFVYDASTTIGTSYLPHLDKTILKVNTHKRNEVYRYGIIFYDKKGRPSFVNWIGDIIIPYFSTEEATSYHYAVDTSLHPVNISIEFTVDTSSFSSDIKGYKIVYVERKSSDTSVLAQGILGTAYDSDFPNRVFKGFSIPSANSVWKGKVAYFYSPDVTVGKARLSETGLKWRSLSWLSTPKAVGGDNYKNIWSDENFPVGNALAPDLTLHSGVEFSGLVPLVLEEDGIAPTPFGIGFSSGSFSNRIASTTGADSLYGPTCYGVFFDTLPYEYTGTEDPTFLVIGEFYRDVFKTMYGGITYADRFINTYIPASEYSPVSNSTVTTFGDSFVSYYEQLVETWDPSIPFSGTTMQACWYFPVESKINCAYTTSKLSKYNHSHWAPDKMSIMEEQVEGITRWPDKYPKELKDLYTYNNVYSLPAYGLFPKYTPKPLLFESNQFNEVLVITSEPKTNAEIVDNWTKFKYNNLLEVDTAYGAVHTLEVMDNNLFFWQDKAFGTLAVNERALIQNGSTGQLTLGTGGVLERYDYISNNVGNVDKYNVSQSENELFWVYSVNSKIYKFGQQLRELSTVKTVNSYLATKDINNPITITDFVGNETLFKIGNEVLVYDWLTQAFTAIYEFEPDWFIRGYDGNFSSSPTSGPYQIWEHNRDFKENGDPINRADFYGLGAKESFIHIVVNDKYPNVKVFDNVTWHSVSENGEGVILYNDTFKEFKVYTEYQTTGWQNINWQRRERNFHTRVPRDIMRYRQDSNMNINDSNNWDTNQTFKRRIRDNLMNLELKYDNTSGNKFSFPYVIINYRQSAR